MKKSACLNCVATSEPSTTKTAGYTQKKFSMHTKLSAAVLAGLATLGVTTSEAVHVSPDGRGQVLIYPYYTVRNSKGNASDRFDTYVSVTNRHNQANALKVRFREARRGAEVLSFNLFLSRFDMWTGAVVRTQNGAMLISNDRSCTAPNNLFALKNPALPAAQIQMTPNVFKNHQYQTAFDDGVFGLDRTREGYFEVIEMGVITDSALIEALEHNANGIPVNCSLFGTLDKTLGGTLAPPGGGLSGRASLLSATTGAHFAYDATALTQWSDQVRYTESGGNGPAITNASPPVSRVMTDEGVVQATWAEPRDAVSATLMNVELTNEYVLDSATLSGTDWVVMFPTKSAYVQPGNGPAKAPFDYNNDNGACYPGSYVLFDREGKFQNPPGIIFPSVGLPIDYVSFPQCWQTNVISFDRPDDSSSMLLGSPLSRFFTAHWKKSESGWFGAIFNISSITPTSAMLLKLDGTVSKIKGTHYGLPVVGFMVHDYINNSVPGSTYGGLLHHKTSAYIDMEAAP